MEFADLEFKEHPGGFGGKLAEVKFDNGYGASVIIGGMPYSGPNKPYELAVLKGDILCYDTHITDDILGYLAKDDVTRLLTEIEELEGEKCQK